MFKIPCLFHVRWEYAVTVINPWQKKRAGANKDSSEAQDVGALPAHWGENNSENSYHLWSMSIPLFSLL